MTALPELILIVLVAALGTVRQTVLTFFAMRLRTISSGLAVALSGILSFAGCIVISLSLHNPVPRVHDEFSYMLMADTLAHGRVANQSPPLPEFFDTFHVLMHPVYASKYFPAQGIFLAIGQKLTGTAAVGVWFSSALACAAIYWMLNVWIDSVWSLIGSVIFVSQFGIFSYWSQSYWGGMVPALGGALAFGGVRRLWDRFLWKDSIWLAVGIVLLVNSRPFEGFLALLPLIVCFGVHVIRSVGWRGPEFQLQFLLPLAGVLLLGGILTAYYNRAITGSPWTPPYVLHERQYQESPQFTFLPPRPKITYSSPWVQYYYEVYEMRLYQGARIPKYLLTGVTKKLEIWWRFFCGVLLTPALIIPPLLRRGTTRYTQLALLLSFALLFTFVTPQMFILRGIIDVLALVQIGVLWITFDDFWERLAIATCTLVLLESWFVKFFFPHYFAPAACLVLYLQVSGLRRIWRWNPQREESSQFLNRRQRRRLSRESTGDHWMASYLRGLVYALPVACMLSLVLRVEGRINGWHEDSHSQTGQALLMNDWSLRRAELEKWLEQQPKPQLVFVWYSIRHRVNDEWVYNCADVMHSQVVWARDLGAEHNQLLLKEMPERTVWFLDADSKDPKLIPYAEVRQPNAPAPAEGHSEDDRDD